MPSEDVQAADDAIVSALASPARAKSDAGEVDARPIPDLIAAAKYLRGIEAALSPRRGLRITRLIPDGTVQDPCS